MELEEAGPEMVLTLRRTRFASSDLKKESLRKPPQLRVQREKNRETDAFGQQRGRVHMQRQDLNTMATRRFKGLKKKSASEAAGEGEGKGEGAGASADDAGANAAKHSRKKQRADPDSE